MEEEAPVVVAATPRVAATAMTMVVVTAMLMVVATWAMEHEVAVASNQRAARAAARVA